MRAAVVRISTLIVTCTAFLGCSDAPDVTSPARVDGPAPARLVLPSPTQYNVVTRDVPLATAEAVSKTVGLFG